MAGWAALSAGLAGAARPPVSPATAYVHARAAEAARRPTDSIAAYRIALTAAPENAEIAKRLLAQALFAGDNDAMLAAAQAMEANNKVGPEARLILLADAIRGNDWADVSHQADLLVSTKNFAFAAPIIRAWAQYQAGAPDALNALDSSGVNHNFNNYYAQHRGLILLAQGDLDHGIPTLVQQFDYPDNARTVRLKLLAAAALANKGAVDGALSLLDGNRIELLAARQKLKAGKAFTLPVATAAQGSAELLLNVAADLSDIEESSSVALAAARAALMINPRLTEARLVTANLLDNEQQPDLALQAIASLPEDDIYAANILNVRIRYYADMENYKTAINLALAATRAPAARPDDFTRLGELYGNVDQFDDAITAYQTAISMITRATSSQNAVPWTLYLLKGDMLAKAGRWPAARDAFNQAVTLAPEQALALNYLGYGMLEHHEDLPRATQLIEHAARLKPEDASITDSLGWAYYLTGKTNQAIAALERATLAEPGDPAINDHLGDAYWQAGRRTAARYAWRAALVHAATADATRIKAKIDTGPQPIPLTPPPVSP